MDLAGRLIGLDSRSCGLECCGMDGLGSLVGRSCGLVYCSLDGLGSLVGRVQDWLGGLEGWGCGVGCLVGEWCDRVGCRGLSGWHGGWMGGEVCLEGCAGT